MQSRITKEKFFSVLCIFGHYICIYKDLSSFTKAHQMLKRIFVDSDKRIQRKSFSWKRFENYLEHYRRWPKFYRSNDACARGQRL